MKLELKKDSNTKQPEAVLQKRLQEDFVVKNMPAFDSLSATSYADDRATSTSKQSEGIGSIKGGKGDKKVSSKSMGLIIIISGIVVIGLIVYLAYRFLIAPAMTTPVNETPVNNVPENNTAVVVQPGVVVEPVAEVDNLTASSSEEMVPVDNTPAEIMVEEDNLVLPTVLDSDGDGLSDAAELFLGTNAQIIDTDNDAYSDFEEVTSGYNPNGAGKLEENNNLALFSNNDAGFVVVYPHDWEVNIVSSDSTLFSAPDSSFIQISREDSEQINTDIMSWYQEKFMDVDTLTQDRFIDSNFGPGILSADQQIAYFLGSDKQTIYVVSYIKAGEATPYMEIFKMMASTLMPL
jgi:hypothetical protein